MNNMKLGEKNISVSYFLPKNKRQNPFAKSNLYIKQFPINWKKEEVENFVQILLKFMEQLALAEFLRTRISKRNTPLLLLKSKRPPKRH